jgi:hypothetical protein
MPSSFSRFLSAEELERVRELYLESLDEEDHAGANVGPLEHPALSPDGSRDSPVEPKQPIDAPPDSH